MKKLVTIISLGIMALGSAQVIIGGTTGTAPSNKKDAVLLEFEAGQNKGIILPYVKTMPAAADVTPGTILVDVSTPTSSAVKYYAPGNTLADGAGWVDLSLGTKGNLTTVLANQPNITESTTSKAIIGATTSSAKGVLVLESTTKAMVLPTAMSYYDIKNPAPGMMVYLTGTLIGPKNLLAVYNGNKWTFWSDGDFILW